MSIGVVTGANRGLGFATARALAGDGACVLLAGRDRTKTEQAPAELRDDGLDVQPLEIDVTDSASVAVAAKRAGEEQCRIDVLVNNAGILPEATDGSEHWSASIDLFTSTFATNVFGVVAVTEGFLPLMRRSPMGRIVNVSTTMGSLTDQTDPEYPYYQMVVPAYQASKAALNSVTISLAKKLADTDIKVTSVCPGSVQTDLTPINRDQAPLTADAAARVIVRATSLANDAQSGTFIDQDGQVSW